jgi:hypothetical protein
VPCMAARGHAHAAGGARDAHACVAGCAHARRHGCPQADAITAALDVGLARALHQRAAYEPFRQLAAFDVGLDLPSLAPAYAAHCKAAAAALVAAHGAGASSVHACARLQA